jgi:hypothetical protein
MRRIFIIVLCAILGVCTTKAQTKESGVFVELGVGYGHQDESARNNGNNLPATKYGIIEPRIGYKINPKWSVGGMCKFETADDTYNSYGAFVNYSFITASKFSVYVELQADYNKFINNDIIGGSAKNYCEVGATLGATYSLSKHLNLFARGLYVGYSSSPRSFEGGLGNGYFKLSAASDRLRIGVQFII